MDFHYGKHHKAYVDKAVELIRKAGMSGLSLDQVILQTAGSPDKAPLFNNAAQAWNHDFYWKCMVPGGSRPGDDMMKHIQASFGSYDHFKKEFVNAALTQFGSGWAWLVADGGRLKVVRTSNADNPMVSGQKPLLTIDVWEHAYYLDYQNRRADYVNAVVDNLLNWDFAASNMAKA
jgi:Fe-Mn family superoxide dismutase